MKTEDLYIDLGTTNTLIYAKGRGFLLNQPTCLSVLAGGSQSGGSQVIAVGSESKKMLGRTPQRISVQRPLSQGVIADFEQTQWLLSKFVSDLKSGNLPWRKPRVLISLPCQVTQFEMQSIQNLKSTLGASKIQLIHEPIAAALGAKLPVLGYQGSMVIDIGGGTTEIAVISMGGIIHAQAVRVGGNTIDQAIVEHLANHYRIGVGEQTAELLKMRIGNATDKIETILLAAVDLTTGLPRRFEIDSQMIKPAIEGVVAEIIKAVRKALENCPPEIAGDLSSSGIALAGGGSLLKGLAARLSSAVNVPVFVVKDPLLSVARGGAKALDDSQVFDRLESPT